MGCRSVQNCSRKDSGGSFFGHHDAVLEWHMIERADCAHGSPDLGF
jgi:hypothetical protein